jgi:hypothetical protein
VSLETLGVHEYFEARCWTNLVGPCHSLGLDTNTTVCEPIIPQQSPSEMSPVAGSRGVRFVRCR